MSGFAVVPEEIRATAPSFAAQGDLLTAALHTLQARLNALGAPWGEDKQGREWGATFERNRPVIEDTMRLLGDGMRSGCDCLAAMADNFDAVERANTIAGS